jgi:indolepyruvate ferredoxin oxidoreductase
MIVPHREVSLDDKYALDTGQLYLTGTQALVRLMLVQARRDRVAGLKTAGFVSGYRGSPVAAVDQQMWAAQKHLAAHDIKFQPGLNEELAATSVWGTQQVGLWPGATVDGVFAMWYGKGPGVDRSGDVFKHANHYGTAPHGGVLAVAGDDHACKTTTVAAQNDFGFMSHSMPVVVPGNVQELLDFGILGFALSRFSGLWVSFKVLADVIDTSTSLWTDPFGLKIITPADFDIPAEGLNIRLDLHYSRLDERIQRYKIPAAKAFARANNLNRVLTDPARPRIGIISYGKTAFDVMQALADLGLSPGDAARAGIRVLKLGMTWPIDESTITGFARDLEEIIVVEDRHPVVEQQVKSILFNTSRVRIVGKEDESGAVLFKSWADLSTTEIAIGLAGRLERIVDAEALRLRRRFLEAHAGVVAATANDIPRKAYFCSGCPHNTSTKVIDGSRALGGIGCHYIATWVEGRKTDVFTQMGGEGAGWIGQAPYRDEKHIFANLGDGTYLHSGILAIRAAVAAGVNITYKLLFNGAVAMTGGQPLDGTLSVPQLTFQLHAEAVSRVVVVSETPERYHDATLAPGTRVESRSKLQEIETGLRDVPGTTVIIYDQTCATEKRRRRKRGELPDPDTRLFINDRVCEGCGDCSVQSNCVSVVPLETEFGRKRRIDQSNCNKDLSCVQGFCPSFVTVRGGKLRRVTSNKVTDPAEGLPEPVIRKLDTPFNMVITGIGGTGVVTIGAILGMAAHMEQKAITVLDSLGFSQKGGGVTTEIKLANSNEEIPSLKISDGTADLLLACDNLLAANAEVLKRLRKGLTKAVVNGYEQITPAFIRDPDFRNPTRAITSALETVVGEDAISVVNATRTAEALLGDAIGTNLFLVGFAWQKGLIPLGRDAIYKAIELNAVSVAMNKAAFAWGRRAATDPEYVSNAFPSYPVRQPPAPPLDKIIERREADLVAYQDSTYARRYHSLIARVMTREAEVTGASGPLAEAVARNFYKLLAYKDEYEVARLYSSPEFVASLNAQFEDIGKLEVHLAPPLLARTDSFTGLKRKMTFGPWLLKAMPLLAALKILRGTALDPFGYTKERRTERRLILDYEVMVDQVLEHLNQHNHKTAVAIAQVPDQIRGYGHVKEKAIATAKAKEQELLNEFRRNDSSALIAAE